MRKKLGEILIEQGAVLPEDVAGVLEHQSGGDPSRIGDLLLGIGRITQLQLARALAAQSGLPLVQLDQVSPEVAALVPIALQREHCLLPFKEDGPRLAIHVAVADPTTREVIAELEFQVGRPLKVSIAARDEIEAVHAALQGDVLDASIVDDEVPVDPPSSQPLGRIALKRVAVSANGGVIDPPPPPSAPVPGFAAEVPPLELPTKPARFPRPSAPGSYHPTVELPVAAPAEPAPLPPRAVRPVRAQPIPPPMLHPVEPAPPPAPVPVIPPRPRSKPVPAVAKPLVIADEWAVRPASSAIPRGGPKPAEAPSPPVLDPFASMPTELIGGPRDYVPPPSPGFPPASSGAMPPLSALDEDPEMAESLRGPELPPGREAPVSTRVEFQVPPPIAPMPGIAPVPMNAIPAIAPMMTAPSIAPITAAPSLAPVSVVIAPGRAAPSIGAVSTSKLAIEPAPLALSPPRRKPVAKQPAADHGLGTTAPGSHSQAPDAELFAPPAATSLQFRVQAALDAEVLAPPAPTTSHFAVPDADLSAPPAATSLQFPEAHLSAEPASTSLQFPVFDAGVSAPPAAMGPDAELFAAAPTNLHANRTLVETQDAFPPAPAPSPVPDATIEVPSTEKKPPPPAVPSGRDKPVETQLEFVPPPSSPRDLPVETKREFIVPEPSPPSPREAAVSTQPEHRPFLDDAPLRRTESLEFIPPAETAPRPGRAPLSAHVPPPPRPIDAPELAPPPVAPPVLDLPRTSGAATPPPGAAAAPRPPIDEGSAATPPEGEPVITEAIERPAIDEDPAATPPEGTRALPAENLVSGAMTAPASLEPPAEASAPLGEPLLTAAPVEEPASPPASAPVVSPAPVDLAVSAPPVLDLPEWMREAAASTPAIDDPLFAAVATAGSKEALVRVLRLLVKRGLLTEEELIEALKKK